MCHVRFAWTWKLFELRSSISEHMYAAYDQLTDDNKYGEIYCIIVKLCARYSHVRSDLWQI